MVEKKDIFPDDLLNLRDRDWPVAGVAVSEKVKKEVKKASERSTRKKDNKDSL